MAEFFREQVRNPLPLEQEEYCELTIPSLSAADHPPHPAPYLLHRPRGSFHLRDAPAPVLQNQFASTVPITDENPFITPGLTSTTGALVFSLCDRAEVVMVPEPLYNGFKVDIKHGTNVWF